MARAFPKLMAGQWPALAPITFAGKVLAPLPKGCPKTFDFLSQKVQVLFFPDTILFQPRAIRIDVPDHNIDEGGTPHPFGMGLGKLGMRDLLWYQNGIGQQSIGDDIPQALGLVQFKQVFIEGNIGSDFPAHMAKLQCFPINGYRF